jgi:hypothetical protein
VKMDNYFLSYKGPVCNSYIAVCLGSGLESFHCQPLLAPLVNPWIASLAPAGYDKIYNYFRRQQNQI